MINNPNSISSIESSANTRKSSKFVENTKRAVRKVLATTWIVASSMLPINTSTALPVSANKIISIEPTTSTTIKTVWQWTTADLLTAFNEKDNEVSNQETSENNNIEEANQSEINTTRWEDQNTTENNNSNINTIGYNAIEITNINPENLMPKVEIWDKNVYKHIEHLRIPESTVITDMMWKYGAGNYSAEEYQNLMMRLNTGMMWENPLDYDNYEAVWWAPVDEPDNHAHAERFTLNTLIKHANFKVINPPSANHYEVLYNLCKQDPNKINIMWISIGYDVDRSMYESRDTETMKEYLKEKNVILFWAWWNIRNNENWVLTNKTYQENYNLPDEHSVYTWLSTAHDKIDNTLNRHIMITFGTNKNWDIDQTNEKSESSKFPVGFHDKVLFSGRTLPYKKNSSDKVRATTWKYATSHTNYVNVALADLCFQMKADTPDVDQLLEMIRSTALTDYIRFDLNGDGDTDDTHDGQPETQPLLLMNPAWFFQKYLMPTSIPTNLKSDETTPLEKWYYHGVVYQIPGAEVNINGQWVPFTDDNKSLIFSQNPMNLEWRLNGETLNNYNYKPGDTINGQIIAVDDQWNGLNIAKNFSVNIEDASGINSVTMDYTPNAWYTIDGIRLGSKPTKPGIYIVNGQKIIIK